MIPVPPLLEIAFRQHIMLRARLSHRIRGIEGVADLLRKAPSYCAVPLLMRYGAVVGSGVRVKRGVRIDNASGDRDATGDFSNLVIGDRCYVGDGVFFDLPDEIRLEDEVVLSAGVMIITHADCGDRVMSRWYPRRREPVRIGRGSWIGAGAIVLPGVELGECCVVAAGSVVRSSFPARSLIAGVPARAVKRIGGEAP